jgi:hypothetical protein
LSEVESGKLSGSVCATTVTTIHYLAMKVVGTVRAKGEIRKLLSIVEVAGVNRGVLEEALESKLADFDVRFSARPPARPALKRSSREIQAISRAPYCPSTRLRRLWRGSKPESARAPEPGEPGSTMRC